jgi:hypothetical protein
MVQAQHDASAAAGRDHMQQQSQQPEHQQQQQQGATTASIVASAAMELALPGSPVLAGSILQDMRSNDSAGLHSMLDQILNEDLNMADSTLALLRGSDSGLPPIAPQRSSAFDPPVITLPPLPEAPPCSQSTGYQGTAGAGPAGAAGAGAAASPSPRPQAPPPTPIGGVGAVLGGGALAAAAGGQANGMSCSSGMQMSAGQGVTQDHWGMGGIKAEQQTAQANTSGQQMHSGAYQQQQQHGQHQQLQQQQPQQQQQQMGGMPQGLPSRPGSSAGMAAQGAAMPAQSPEPAALSPNMSMLCAQLQQENMLLMHKLHQMEQHHIGGSHPAASPAPAAAAGPAAAPCGAEPSMAHIAPAIPGQPQVQQQQAPASAAGPAAAAAQPVASAGMSWGGFDALLPQLRPVLTRVGGSAGGALSAGGSLGGLCPSDLVSESPAQLINTAFLDDHGLLGGL